MIARYVLHLEAHRGHWPRVSLRRAPRPGQRVVDGGVPGTLVRCRECGEGFLHQPDDGIGRPRVLEPNRAARGLAVIRAVGDRLRADQARRAVPSPAGKNDQAPEVCGHPHPDNPDARCALPPHPAAVLHNLNPDGTPTVVRLAPGLVDQIQHVPTAARSAVDAAIDAAYDLDGLCDRGNGEQVPASTCRACVAEAVVAGLADAGLLR